MVNLIQDFWLNIYWELDVGTMEKNVHNIPSYQNVKFENFWSKVMPSFSISKLSQFWIKWKINKTTWAPFDSLTDQTTLRPRRPPQTTAAADLLCPRFPAAGSPPLDSPPRRPPSTASTGYKGSSTPPPINSLSSSCSSPWLRRLVPPLSIHHVAPPPVPLRAPRRCHEHPAAVPLRPTTHRRGARPSGEDPLFWPPVGCAVLPSRPSAPPLQPPPPASQSWSSRRQRRHWPSALPLFGHDGPPA
jgi:hypothetical protein